MEQPYLDEIKKQTASAMKELLALAKLKEGELFILGGSSSEVLGEHIGKASSAEVGEAVVGEAARLLDEQKVYLAVQCCEHLNRSLVVERAYAEKHNLTEVNALPQLHAGGSFAVAAWARFKDPCLVEAVKASAGLDVGDALIGMHLKNVAIPLRLQQKTIGRAHLSSARTRLKLIGGERAVYQKD